MLRRHTLARIAGLIALAIGIRIASQLTIAVWTHLPWAIIVAGHDAAEYLAMSQAFARLEFHNLPGEVWRHDVGWPLLLAPLVGFVSAPVAAAIVSFIALGASIVLVVRLARRTFAAPSEKTWAVGAAYAVAYPATVYYGCFALSEPLFVLCILVAAVGVAEQRWWLWGPAVGLAACVRSTGLLLLPAAVIALLASPCRSWAQRAVWRDIILGTVISLLLPSSIAAMSTALWGTLPLTEHQPLFGWPFAGFSRVMERGSVRGIYLALCVALVAFATGKLALQAYRVRTIPYVFAAVFCTAFVTFHLVLRSLVYYGQRIETGDYFDRYMLGVWPFVVLALKSWWRPRVVTGLGVLAFALTVSWGKNYFRAAERYGAPLLEIPSTPPRNTPADAEPPNAPLHH